MDYQKVYDAIIFKWRTKIPDGYSEIHHIIPRCMGGSNAADNLVRLPARDHFVAHQCLAKIHKGAFGGKLLVAAFLMSKDGKHGNRDYAWLRTAYAQHRSDSMQGNTIMIGKKLSSETRAKLSEVRIGNKYGAGNKGNIAWNKGKKMNPNHGDGARIANTGKRHTKESREKMSFSQIGNTKGHGKLGKKTGSHSIVRSEEHREKLAKAAREMWKRRKSLVS